MRRSNSVIGIVGGLVLLLLLGSAAWSQAQSGIDAVVIFATNSIRMDMNAEVLSGDIVVNDFMPNPLVAIAPLGHPLAKRKRLALTDLAAEPFLMREAGSGTRHAIERHLEKQGVRMNVRMTIESNEAIKHAVMSGLGISILSEHTLTYGGSNGLTRLLSLIHISEPTRRTIPSRMPSAA